MPAMRWGLLLTCLVVLAACALPVPVRVASWAIDGISFVATRKSITDHGISLVAQQDCSIWRGVTSGRLCVEEIPGITTVAAAGGRASALVSVAVETDGADELALARFATAAGTGQDIAEADARPLAVPLPATRIAGAATVTSAVPSAAVPSPAETRGPAAAGGGITAATPRARTVAGAGTDGGLYFVVGSFAVLANAEGLVDRHPGLDPMVFAGTLDGRTIYRVAVGPVAPGDKDGARRRLVRAGIYDAWAIKLNSAEWTVAATGRGSAVELATIPGPASRR